MGVLLILNVSNIPPVLFLMMGMRLLMLFIQQFPFQRHICPRVYLHVCWSRFYSDKNWFCLVPRTWLKPFLMTLSLILVGFLENSWLSLAIVTSSLDCPLSTLYSLEESQQTHWFYCLQSLFLCLYMYKLCPKYKKLISIVVRFHQMLIITCLKIML